ncbi:carboxypeptidase regulatory-like domain-containing protein [Gracilimonas amylolytica]|uniref:carboxypeptidase regulatory-like domain-containing protein n=1 Tax=Gracilimonas amylolytica TaxID=1749045 RepID=UPI000CD96567|nr:carboxypeptidase regulatory-like domain-containing protein [Gracilimonas amylolytica]
MRKISLLLFSALFLVFSSACTTDDDDLVLIQGVVSDSQTGDGIANATVQITSPQELSDTFVRSDDNGSYSLADIEVSELTSISITASATDYNSQSRTVQVAGGDTETDFNFELTPEDTGGGGPSDGGGVSGPSAGAAAIILNGITEETINIAETGGIVNTSFTFQVQDSAGRALDINNAEEVEFSILSGPGGGEGITPLTATTNANGTVTSNLFSGNLAGVVQIQAEIVREDIGLTIRSKPVAITIHGGFPDLDHFSIAADAYNFEGWSVNGNRNGLTVILGDQFGNPVKPGTAVYFSTTGGIIQGSGQGNTNDDGEVTVDLISGDPRPTDNVAGSDGRPGYATVTAKTINGDSQEIEKNVIILFTSSEALVSANPTTFDLQPNGGASFTYTVTDINGNPMPAGTQISVEGGEGIEVTGATDFTLGNRLFPGPGSTEFNFSIRDTDEESNDPADLTIKITVTSPSGEETVYDQISGTRRKTAN